MLEAEVVCMVMLWQFRTNLSIVLQLSMNRPAAVTGNVTTALLLLCFQNKCKTNWKYSTYFIGAAAGAKMLKNAAMLPTRENPPWSFSANALSCILPSEAAPHKFS
jgi:hypothetical protein